MGNKKRKYTESSGKKKERNILRTIKTVKSKINRWDKYRIQGKPVSQKNKNRSRANNWDVSGLKNYVSVLSKCL